MEKLRENYRNLERFYAEDMNKMTHIINSLSDNAQVFISPTNNEKVVGEIDTDIKIGDIVIDDGSVNPDQKGFIYKVEDIHEEELSEWFKSDFDVIKPEDDVVVCVYHQNGEKYALLTSGVSKEEPASAVTVEDVEGTDAITDGVTEDTIINVRPSELIKNAFVFYRKKEEEETAWLATKNTANGVGFFSDPNAEGAQNKNIQIEYHPESAITCIFTICDDDKKRYFYTDGSIFKTEQKDYPNTKISTCDFNFFVKKSKFIKVVTLSVLNDGSGGGGSSEGHIYNTEKDSLAEGTNETFGVLNTASGIRSHAEGRNTTASGEGSHTEGHNTTASGNYSHAEGCASAENSYIQANNVGAHAEGCTDGTNSYIEASGSGSHAEGCVGGYNGYIRASGKGAHAEGCTDGTNSYIEASGEYGSHAEGCNTTASGYYGSHAEGCNTTASGEASHAEGSGTTASSYYSHTEGFLTEASGYYAHAEGRRTQAINGEFGEHAEGSCNISHVHTISSIGCGGVYDGVEIRCNAFEVLSEGDIYIKGVGGYTGQNDPNSSDVKSLQDYITLLENRIRQLENNQ